MKVKSNSVGVCPRCNGSNLDYDCAENVGDMIFYKYICIDCACEGEEWYKIEFAGHNIIDKNGDSIEITDNMIESEETK